METKIIKILSWNYLRLYIKRLYGKLDCFFSLDNKIRKILFSNAHFYLQLSQRNWFPMKLLREGRAKKRREVDAPRRRSRESKKELRRLIYIEGKAGHWEKRTHTVWRKRKEEREKEREVKRSGVIRPFSGSVNCEKRITGRTRSLPWRHLYVSGTYSSNYIRYGLPLGPLFAGEFRCERLRWSDSSLARRQSFAPQLGRR